MKLFYLSMMKLKKLQINNLNLVHVFANINQVIRKYGFAKGLMILKINVLKARNVLTFGFP